LVIDSMPPATTMSAWPAAMSWSARMIALRPERQTLLMGGRRHGHRDAAVDRGLAGRDLTGAGAQHVAHVDVVDLLGRHAGALQRGLDGETTQRGGGERRERPRQLADRGACPSDDDRSGHGRSSELV